VFDDVDDGVRRDREAQARRAIVLIDLTDLADDHAVDGIDRLCDRAAEHATAAVCVWPEHAARCARRLSGTGVRVATVVNFPTGEEPVTDVVSATRSALDDGADEIDVVLPYRAFAAGDVERAGDLVSTVSDLVEAPSVLKVILETGALEPSAAGPAARLAIDRGADFVKTSTGKLAVGATLTAAGAMLGEIAASERPVGLKPSGGIRTFDDADAYLTLADRTMGPNWASPSTFRFGASGLLDALVAVLAGDDEPNGRAHDSY
jgi:deoxyribose-phosphate aldolase